MHLELKRQPYGNHHTGSVWSSIAPSLLWAFHIRQGPFQELRNCQLGPHFAWYLNNDVCSLFLILLPLNAMVLITNLSDMFLEDQDWHLTQISQYNLFQRKDGLNHRISCQVLGQNNALERFRQPES